MSWNDGFERKKFNARIKKEIAEYKAAGMTEEQITAIVSLYYYKYRSERRYNMTHRSSAKAILMTMTAEITVNRLCMKSIWNS